MPQKLTSASAEIAAIEGVEVHAQTPDGRIVIVVEDTLARFASETIMALHQVSGVISLTLTYHHFESPDGQHSDSPQSVLQHDRDQLQTRTAQNVTSS